MAKFQRIKHCLKHCLACVVLRGPLFHHHYHYLNSYTGFLLLIESILNCSLLHIVLYLHNNHTWLVSCIFQISLGSSDNPLHNNLLFVRLSLIWANCLFFVAARMVWNELFATVKTSETIATFRKNPRHLFQIAFLSYLRLSLVLIMTFARPCSQLCLMVIFCCASELRFLRI